MSKLASPSIRSTRAAARPAPVPPVFNPPSGVRLAKQIIVAVLLVVLLSSIGALLFTARGRALLRDPHALRADAIHIVHAHPLCAPLLFIAVYVPLALVAMPVWWLQILAGISFGMYEGTLWSLISSTAAAGLTVVLARWVAADWFRTRVESRMDKLRKLDTTLGHNGFLVVITVRLIHLLPFGLCNYALGLSKVSLTDVVVGTFLGSLPAVATYVGAGAGLRPWRNWGFTTVIAGLNVLMLVPLLLRYLRPQWFRRIGVE